MNKLRETLEGLDSGALVTCAVVGCMLPVGLCGLVFCLVILFAFEWR